VDTQTTDPLRYRVAEEVPRGTIIADLITDLGLRQRYSADILQQLEFRILASQTGSATGTGGGGGGGGSAQFTIGTKTGVISTHGGLALDRDAMTQCRDRDVCEVTLDVAIKPAQYFQIAKVTVEVGQIGCIVFCFMFNLVPNLNNCLVYLSVNILLRLSRFSCNYCVIVTRHNQNQN